MSKAEETLVIAHRGASGYLPEHTLAAKAMAHAMNAHFIEQDVVLTKDGVPIILHDRHLDTVSNVANLYPNRKRADGRYYAIDFTLAEIRQLTAHERIDLKTGKTVFPGRFPLGLSTFKIPTLQEEIDLIQGLNASTGKKIGLYVELKKPAFHREEGQDISKIVLKLLAENGYMTKEDAVFIQCFDWNETRRIRTELGYQGKLIQLIADNSWNEAPDVDFDRLMSPQGLAEITKVADGIGPWLNQVIRPDGTPTPLVRHAHEADLKVHAYTLRADDLPGWGSSHDAVLRTLLLEAKVDGVFTDFPDLSVDFLSAQQ